MLRIAKPYLLFVADVREPILAKLASGIAHWRPDDCVGEFALIDEAARVGLPRLDLASARERGAKTMVLGVVNSGGFMQPAWVAAMRKALEVGYDLAAGMHSRLADIPELASTARRLGRTLHDVRQPPPGLPVGTGEPRSGRRILTVGTDCAVGKMFTALAIEQELQRRGLAATFRATGQTGILIAGAGIAVDAVVADFISGATEQLAPANDPEHWDVIEGQGSLFHPSFAGVSLGLLHGSQAHRLVLCHEPTRTQIHGLDRALPTLAECIRVNEEAGRLTNPECRVVAIGLNTKGLDADAAARCRAEATAATGLPAADPVRDGAGTLVDAILGADR